MFYLKIIKKVFQILIMVLMGFANLAWAYAQEDVYRIGARDVLSVSIYAGGESQQAVEATVNEQGEINVPFIGTVRAEGLTSLELEEHIISPLGRDYFVNPEVMIHIKEYHSLRYYISGAVNQPGLYETTAKASLMTLIAKSGGVLEKRGNVAYILRNLVEQAQNGKNVEKLILQTEPIKVNLKKLLDQGDMSENLLLRSGDVVYIPLEREQDVAASNIYVEGEIKKPGVYNFRPGLTALNACLMAGGFDKYAAPNRTKIIRKKGNKQIIIPINLNKVKRGKIQDVELQPGDLINVPESWL